MQLEIQKYLFDIQTSIDSIYEYIANQRTFNDYLNNKQLRRSVERELEIIGEAVSKIIQLDPDIPIENTRKIISLRNRVIHYSWLNFFRSFFVFSSPVRDTILVKNSSPLSPQSPVRDVIGKKILRPLRDLGFGSIFFYQYLIPNGIQFKKTKPLQVIYSSLLYNNVI